MYYRMLSKNLIKITTIVSLIALNSCKTQHNKTKKAEKMNVEKEKVIQAPVAAIKSKELSIHGDTRIDDYYWMNDRENPEVIQYLNEENDYTEGNLEHLSDFKKTLYDEMISRIKQTDMSVPYKLNGYYYFSRFEEGKDYPIYSRKKGNLDAEEEIMLNVNEMAEGYSYFQIGGKSISNNNKIIAYSQDTLSRRIYTIKFKNLETGEILKDEIPNTTEDICWANDNKTVFYTVKDEALRAYKIYKHRLGEDPKDDQLIFHEEDETFDTHVYKTKSKKFLIIGSVSTVSTEYRILNADNPEGEFKVFQARKRDHEYAISHFGDKFYITTNQDAKNFKLMECPDDKTEMINWTEVIPHREEVLLEDIDIFSKFMVLTERNEGLMNIRIIPWDKNQSEYYLEFDDPTYYAYTGYNPSFETDELRYGYTSLTTPNTLYAYDMNDKTKEVLKVQEVMGGKFDSNNYESQRLMVEARDGAKVPVSLVYPKGYKMDGSSPLLLYAYGSYGYSMNAYFSSTRLSLLDRGLAFAIAHIRGGEDLGREWYENGKLLKKKNTFNDFIDCSKYLIENKYTSKDKLCIMGGSAGGLLMGAVINDKPELFKAAVAQVPFVDVVTTMLDESIPLTTGEYDEWGNPNNKEYYDYMLSYSPYDNIKKQDYPALLVISGLHDSQVQYWEPTKWVAKLRTLNTGSSPILLKTNMKAGHGGASGRLEGYKETALEYAFILNQVGINE